MEKLEDRVAIVTGGSGALGRAVVENFLVAGARVAVPWVVQDEVPMLKQRLAGRFPDSQIMLERADVGEEAQVARFVEAATARFGKVDILVNLVGGFWGGKPISETTTAEWDAMFALNLRTAFLCCRAVVPIMQKNHYGRIVSVTSRSGLTGAGDFAAYAVAKGAIATLTASLAEEVIGDGVMGPLVGVDGVD